MVLAALERDHGYTRDRAREREKILTRIWIANCIWRLRMNIRKLENWLGDREADIRPLVRR